MKLLSQSRHRAMFTALVDSNYVDLFVNVLFLFPHINICCNAVYYM